MFRYFINDKIINFIIKDMKDNNLESVRMKITNPNLRQRIIIIRTNFLLWLIVKFNKNNEQKMKEVVISAFSKI